MSLVVLDQAASSKLSRHQSPVMVCDDTGQVLGHFVPATQPERLNLEPPPLTEAELAERTGRTGGRTLGEIMLDLVRRS